ncbi:MAG: peptidase M28 [Bacteroidetes bacterium]|nr:peptidase M28 [Bacteroidota bacterium]
MIFGAIFFILVGIFSSTTFYSATNLKEELVQTFSVLIFSALLLFIQPNKIDKNSRVGYESILASDLKRHLAVLTADSLEGRETAYPGQKKAAHYIAGVFKKLRLKPVGDNGSYFQKFDVEEIRVSTETRIEVQQKGKSKTYTWGKEFIGADAQDTTVTGDIVFGGFADSPMSSQDKEKLSGKLVVTFPGQRESVNDTSMDQIRRRFFAFRQEKGLLAVLVVTDEEGAFSQSEVISRIKSRTGRGRMTLKGATTTRVRLPLTFYISPTFAQELLHGRGLSLKDVRERAIKDSVFSPVFLENTAATVHSKSLVETRQSENVAGFLEGSDAKLKDEILVFTAHYDHLGVGSDGAIYHGADDDGSGTSTVLELAEAFVKT